MAHVINRNYSKFYDVKTRVQFEPVLEGRSGVYVAHAQTGAEFGERPGFEVLSDGDYLELISAKREGAEGEAQMEAVSTGDPVRDAAASLGSGSGSSRGDTPATSDSRRGRRADGRKPLAPGDMIDPASPAAREEGEAGAHD